MNRDVTLQTDETEQNDLKQAVSFSVQVEAFSDAELETRIPRDAYPSELSMKDVIKKTNIFMRNWLEEYNKEIKAQLGIPDS